MALFFYRALMEGREEEVGEGDQRRERERRERGRGEEKEDMRWSKMGSRR